METKNLIIHLLLQDLRHTQLLLLLEKEGRDMEAHYLDIVLVVSRLMGAEEVSDQFVSLYVWFMDEAANYPVAGRGESLQELAEQCYTMLVCCLEIERRTTPQLIKI